ncbi:MAG TPA: NUDIX hydrolase [Pirellulales bacterium]|nr:NUDIX hydrolase [Pirellulales bacterium]
MRTSLAALALITRRRTGETEYLAQWNPEWAAFHFVGGHRYADETFRDCLVREIGEELGVAPGGLAMADDPTARLHYVATSRRAGAETAYTMELFDVELNGDELCRIEQRPENAWLGSEEISAEAMHDGRAISPTMSLLLGKTGRLPVARKPDVYAIGVSGHRDLRSDDRAAISRKLSAVFEKAEREAGGRAIEALSPLAAGADQLFGQQALARGYRLISPLPLPLKLYRHDFTGESAAEFEQFLHRAAEWYSLPLGGHSSQAVAVYGPERNEMYEAVGRHVVNRCDLLIALWDGEVNSKRGGTGEIVQYARHATASGPPLQIEIVPVRRQSRI